MSYKIKIGFIIKRIIVNFQLFEKLSRNKMRGFLTLFLILFITIET